MYLTYEPGSKINLWTERKNDPFGPCEDFDDETDTAQKAKKRKRGASNQASDIIVPEECHTIFQQLKEKRHKMESPKVWLWAKLIDLGRHESYE
uniref:Uncharacterized protein n=1 Tax=Amphimedon queenslandica TaxID=400682 RepID=A0A1X7UTM7_AMPQE